MKKRISCRCATCVSWCSNIPGWFGNPAEVEAAALRLKMSVERFVRTRCVIDYYLTDGAPVFVVRPRIKDEEPGIASYAPPRGRCVFLTSQQTCRIHAVKPAECAVSHHARKMNGHIVAGWRSRKAQALVQKWSGQELVLAEPTFGDMINLLFR